MHVSVHFQHSPIKTVGGVRKSAKKCTKTTMTIPALVKPLFGRPRDICPEVTFSKIHIHERFREDRTSGKWSKSGNRRTSDYLISENNRTVRCLLISPCPG